MEEYVFVDKNPIENTKIQIGRYANRIFELHKNKYGEEAAKNIRQRAVRIFSDSIRQCQDKSKNNNVLLVGKVQSGKTSNLEMITGIAFDNKYNLMIIYGGYDNTLLEQTTGRFKKTFEIDNNKNNPILLSTYRSDELAALDDDLLDDLIEDNRPIIITSMKRPNALEKVNKVLTKLSPWKLKAYIIDDEGDQASLNTAKDKSEESSRTYEEICNMKHILNDPLYFSVTATPQANIFLDSISKLRPETARLIEPGNGYCGGELYHMGDCNNIFPIDPDDTLVLDEGRLPESLREAVMHFMIGSIILKKMGYEESTMIVHSHRNKDPHSLIFTMINNLKESLETQLKDDESRDNAYNHFQSVFVKHFPSVIKQKYPFDGFKSELLKICKKTYVILKNSDGSITQGLEELKKHRIYVGGDLLQRGVTFENLITTYYTRWAEKGNMDTNLQRARWFGYRKDYLDICRVFTTKEISEQYSILTDIEMDLWEQFDDVQNGLINISEMVISADNIKMRPTRPNVVTIKKLYFKKNWMKQRLGVFDKRIVDDNNYKIIKFINNYEWQESDAGRKDGESSCKYSIIPSAEWINNMKSIEDVFAHAPFEFEYLLKILAEEKQVVVIQMKDNDGEGRKRSFYSDNNINNIHQGPDKTDVFERKYNGDVSVVIDRDKINIQIHKIRPFKNGKEVEGLIQYMFAIFIPRQKQYFVRGDSDD